MIMTEPASLLPLAAEKPAAPATWKSIGKFILMSVLIAVGLLGGAFIGLLVSLATGLLTISVC